MRKLLVFTLLAASSLAAAQSRQPLNAGTAYVPLREFAGPTGAVVDLVKGNPRLSFEGQSYSFVVNSRLVYAGAGTLTMPAPALQVGGTTYVPAKFFALIGCGVSVPGGGVGFVTVTCRLANGSLARADLSRR